MIMIMIMIMIMSMSTTTTKTVRRPITKTGAKACRKVLARVPSELRRLGRPDAVSRQTRYRLLLPDEVKPVVSAF
jgi:hypothetical protein